MVSAKKTVAKTGIRAQDPFLERESEKYAHPLPSREFIIEMLKKQGVPMATHDLARLLEIETKETAFFTRRLMAMERVGELMFNRSGAACLPEKLNLLKCKVIGHREGYGFAKILDTEEKQDDIYLPTPEMRKVMHSDTVLIRVRGRDHRNRQEGVIVEILERGFKQVVARAQQRHGHWVAKPVDTRLDFELMLEKDNVHTLTEGLVLMVEITSYPAPGKNPVAKVLEVVGRYADPGMEIEIALRKHDLPYVFSEAAIKQATKTPPKVRKKDWTEDRVDLRDLPLVTIDGETARDFDDAVFAKKKGKSYRLVVAIADVSYYVEPGDALDKDAQLRSTSVYFPRRVIPMLPEQLSNGICSLNPDVERMCMVCDMTISEEGDVSKYKFYPAVMQSKARLTYNEVWSWLENGSDNPLKEQIDTLYKVYQLLAAKRKTRGAIEFESTETQMIFNEAGKIEKIIPVVRNEAHRLIEECMLAANVCSAEYLLKNKHPSLFRVHEGPTPEKLENLKKFLGTVGLSVGGGDKPTAQDYAILAHSIQDRPDHAVLQTMLLRSMQQAVYAPDNRGHFGLAYDAYTHFTSPIRRYPDLLVHRSIKAILQKSKYKPGKWESIGEHCSMAERRADDASRDVEAWLKAFYLQDKVGEIFSGKISSVTSFGLFVLLDDLYVEGLIHISSLGFDYFHFRKELQSLVGENTGAKFKIGDTITVKVARVDLDTNQVDFAWIPTEKFIPAPMRAGMNKKSSRSSNTRNDKPSSGNRDNSSRNPEARSSGKKTPVKLGLSAPASAQTEMALDAPLASSSRRKRPSAATKPLESAKATAKPKPASQAKRPLAKNLNESAAKPKPKTARPKRAKVVKKT